MKKLLCMVLAFMMLLPSFSAIAETKEAGAYSDVYATNVYIEGKAESGGQSVTILLKNGESVGYIDEIDTLSDGSYKSKFKFSGDVSDYAVMVRDSATSADITSTLNTAFARHDVYCIDMDLEVDGNDVIHYVSEGDFLDVVTDIDNKYGDNASVKVILAAYNENNKLLATDIQSLAIGFGDLDTTKTISFSGLKLPAGTKKAKVFAWQDTINLMPLAEEEVKSTFDGDLTFANKNANPEDTWVVGLAGASTVHAGQYAAFLYQYYATRYPGKNIVILNKGAAGCTAEDIYNRMHWDIFNENDPLGYGACDEIAIMVGANDSAYWKYVDGKMEDDEYETYYDGTNGRANMIAEVEDCVANYEKIIQWCQENGKGVMLTPMTIYDESDAFDSTLSYGVVYGANHAFGMISDRLKVLAEKYSIPFIDTWGASNEYTTRIREQYPNASLVITGTDGLHHSSNGGYLVGYLIARGQETDEIVASVDIDVAANSSKTDGATVSNLTVSSTGVDYTYLAEALPMYAKADGYVYAEGYGVDITNTMNKEIIKVTGLADGNYTISMDGTDIGTFSADRLAEGVNIATLENNPGQIQAKGLYDNYYKRRKDNENNLRHIFNEELRIRNANHKYNDVDHNDSSYDSYTAQDWIDLCNALVTQGHGTTDAGVYPERKNNQETYVAEVRACIEGLANDSIPAPHTVTIKKQ